MDYRQIAYAELNVPFDREAFAEEYDRYILPKSQRIAAISRKGVEGLARLNGHWGMVPPDIYLDADVTVREPGSFTSVVQENKYRCWLAHSLVVCTSDDGRWAAQSQFGSVVVRNMVGLTHEFAFSPEFEDLQITKFIKSLPLTNIIGARCVSLDPGSFAPIHRDDYGESLSENHLVEAGFVNLSLNISDGGVPLYYALPNEPKVPLKANGPLFMLNDFFLHGVPLTTGRRRQIRITGRPTPEFAALLDKKSMLCLPDDDRAPRPSRPPPSLPPPSQRPELRH